MVNLVCNSLVLPSSMLRGHKAHYLNNRQNTPSQKLRQMANLFIGQLECSTVSTNQWVYKLIN